MSFCDSDVEVQYVVETYKSCGSLKLSV